MGRRIVENLTLSLFADDEEPITAERQQEEILCGVDELYAYNGRRPHQCFTIKMPFPIYLEFKKEVRRWQSIAEQAGLKDRYTMTAFVNAAVQKVILPGLKKRTPRAAA
jgi:hypothetical protein